MNVVPEKQDIRYLKGVGETRGKLFHKLSLNTVGDLLRHYPRGYTDLRSPFAAADVPIGAAAAVKVTVGHKYPAARISGGRSLYRADASDGSAALTLTWFNNRYTPAALKEGETYLFYGKMQGTLLCREMVNPQLMKESDAGGLMPLYPSTEGLSSRMIGNAVKNALELCKDGIAETLPEAIRKKHGLSGIRDALFGIHFPKDYDAAESAKKRLIFEELLILQLGMLTFRARAKGVSGAVIPVRDPGGFIATLPFSLTGAQRRSIGEILRDLAKPEPMSRLLQGDVGSGKTVVAAAGVYAAAKAGFQSAVMVPTEILAQQHAAAFERLLSPFGIRVGILTAVVKGRARKLLQEQLRAGEIGLAIGTQALISKETEYRNLGFVVADEQHRFGVEQRVLLSQKGKNPHLLVMSATPIPRTLALMIYGDLDISVLDELPPGREPVKTYLVDQSYRERYLGFVKKQADSGKQAYIVCPLVEESEEMGDRLAAVKYRDELAERYLSGYPVGLIHGRMRPREKADIMARFRSGEIKILVATTVIEVGVDVPNATVMVIENAERFGLSALHQLRGRIGRGGGESHCILVSASDAKTAKTRLQMLTKTSDGFEIAKFDLLQRGPGDLFGRRQHGLPELRIADLMTDERILYDAQAAAKEIAGNDPGLLRHPALRAGIARMFESADGSYN